MPTLTPISVSEAEIHDDLFGANILGYRDRVGEDGTYDDAIEALGVGAIRYPGGSYTESYFDITDPDRVHVVDNSGEGDPKENLPYSEFMDWAEEAGISVTVVIPTRTQLSGAADANGDRYPDIDEAELRAFVRDTLDGRYGSPELDAFEIGNEYWGSGQMTSVEYGRLAAEMALIIRDEIDSHPLGETRYADLDIAVQMGNNYGVARMSDVYEETGQDLLDRLSEDYGLQLDDNYLYGDGTGAWPKITNQMVIAGFDTQEKMDAIDAVVAHYYSKSDAAEKTSYDLGIIEKEWDDAIPGLTRYVTEWNLKSSANMDQTGDYGLKNAHEILNMVENMSDQNVEVAHVWAVQQNTRTDLAHNEGQEGLSVTGEMFAMMSRTLPGMQKVELAGALHNQHEVSTGTADAHFFFGESGGVLFLASTSDSRSSESIDLSPLMDDYGDISVTRLGVEEGELPNSYLSPARVEEMTREETFDQEYLDVDLEPYEILMVEFTGATASDALEDLLLAEPSEAVAGGDVEDGDAEGDGGRGGDGARGDDDDDLHDDGDDGGSGGQDGSCFVATAAYGGAHHPDVVWLRRWRDTHLLPHPAGRAILSLYWKFGPALADYVRVRPRLAAITRKPIAMIVRISQNA